MAISMSTFPTGHDENRLVFTFSCVRRGMAYTLTLVMMQRIGMAIITTTLRITFVGQHANKIMEKIANALVELLAVSAMAGLNSAIMM